MPNLPTVSVTQSQADRILIAFGGTTEVAVPAYKDWLIKQIRAYVLEQTTKMLAESRAASEAQAYQEVLADLPPEPPMGPML